MSRFVALFRGINVGGHKKVPMKEVKELFEKHGFRNVKTLLASGNVVFEGVNAKSNDISNWMENTFGFAVPTITFPFSEIEEIVESDPFPGIIVTTKTRLYVTFLGDDHQAEIKTPSVPENESFNIVGVKGNAIFSVLDLEKTGTLDLMKFLEMEFGKNITTRNYNTVLKIAQI